MFNLTPLNPLSVRQSHFWARRDLAPHRSLKEAPHRGAELSSLIILPLKCQWKEFKIKKQIFGDSNRGMEAGKKVRNCETEMS